MNNHSGSLELLVLVPHRDVRIALRAWSASLFSAGLCGAWSFPWVMPIAVLKRPLSGAQLKSRALMLRQIIDLSGGKLTTSQPDGIIASILNACNYADALIRCDSRVAALSDNVSVFGPAVNISLSDSFFDFEDAVIRRVSPPVIGSALCRSDALPDVNSPAPSLSFRAAALANMYFRPLPSYNGALNDFSFEWEIGKLHWLPKS